MFKKATKYKQHTKTMIVIVEHFWKNSYIYCKGTMHLRIAAIIVTVCLNETERCLGMNGEINGVEWLTVVTE